jgi:hypothetical protein
VICGEGHLRRRGARQFLLDDSASVPSLHPRLEILRLAIPCVSAVHGRPDPALFENPPLTSILSGALVYGHHRAFDDTEVLTLRSTKNHGETRLATLRVARSRRVIALQRPELGSGQ